MHAIFLENLFVVAGCSWSDFFDVITKTCVLIPLIKMETLQTTVASSSSQPEQNGPVNILPITAIKNQVGTHTSRSKVTISISENSEKGRATHDSMPEGPPPSKKSGAYPMFRRGSRKQTLSLNPEAFDV